MKHNGYVTVGSGIAGLYAALLAQQHGHVPVLRGHRPDPAGGTPGHRQAVFRER